MNPHFPPRASAAAVALTCLILSAPLAAQSGGAAAEDPAAEDAEAPRPLAEVTGLRVTRVFEAYNPSSEKELAGARRMGFNRVILDKRHLAPVAERHGLQIVLAHWWTRDTDPEEIARDVQAAKDAGLRRLDGFSVMDEPERYAPDTPLAFYRDLYASLRKDFDSTLPNVRIEISHWGPHRRWPEAAYDYFIPLYQSADAMRVMSYPDLSGAPLDDVAGTLHRTRKMMQLAERDLPLTVILQAWAPEGVDHPTEDELRVMAFQAAIGGAETISFYKYDPPDWERTAGFPAALQRVMRELTAFAERHRDSDVATTFYSDGVLVARLTRSDGRVATVRINTLRTAVRDLAALEVRIDEPPAARPTAPACPPAPAPVRPAPAPAPAPVLVPVAAAGSAACDVGRSC